MGREFFRLVLIAPFLAGLWADAAFARQEPVVLRRVWSERTRDPELQTAIQRSLADSTNDTENSVYYYNRVDLNGDGKPEVLVYLFGGSLCGTGGCVLIVFRTQGGEYRPVSEIALAQNPIIVSERRTHGWNDLIMKVAGGGVRQRYYAVLHFNGKTYPENPTTPPAMRLMYSARGIAYLVGNGAVGSGIPLYRGSGKTR
jgi:hypothetical protein